MKAFVINLDKDKERLIQFYKAFQHFPVPIERVSAIKGFNVKDEECTTVCQVLGTDTIKGCAASHKLVWKRIVEENIQIAIIFEDDAYPETKNYVKRIEDVVEDAPEDFDLINLFNAGYNTYVDPITTIIFKWIGMYNDRAKVISKNICIPKFQYANSSYIITNSGARKLLRLIPKIKGHMDMAVYTLHDEIKFYSCMKKIFTQKFEISNNSTDSRLSFLPNTLFVNHFLYTSQFGFLGINVSLYKIIVLLLLVLFISIVLRRFYIFGYFFLIFMIIYLVLLRISYVHSA